MKCCPALLLSLLGLGVGHSRAQTVTGPQGQPQGGVLHADTFPGADIVARTMAAYKSVAGAAGKPTPNALVLLAPGNRYIVSTKYIHPNAVTYPYITAPDLDCQGSEIHFQGVRDLEAFVVLARNGGNTGSGAIRNCRLTFGDPGAHIRWEGSTFFKWLNDSVNFTGPSRGIDMVNVNSPVFGSATTGTYFEENVLNFVQISPGSGVGSCALTMRQDPTLANNGSFFYNFLYGWHLDGDGSQGNTGGGICMETSPSRSVPGINAFGNDVEIHLNGGLPVFQLGNNTFFTRAHVSLTGEVNAGNAFAAMVHGPNSLFIARAGDMSATGGWNYSFQDGAHADQIQWLNAEVNIGGDAFPEPGFTVPGFEVNGSNRHLLGYLLSNSTHTLALLPANSGYCNDYGPESTWFRMQTSHAGPGQTILENNLPGAPRTNVMDVTANTCKGVLFGRGYHDQTKDAMFPSFATDAAFHSMAVVPYAPRSTGIVHEDAWFDLGNGTLKHYIRGFDEVESHYKADGSGEVTGTKLTGTCTYAAGAAVTFHIVNGLIVSCN